MLFKLASSSLLTFVWIPAMQPASSLLPHLLPTSVCDRAVATRWHAARVTAFNWSRPTGPRHVWAFERVAPLQRSTTATDRCHLLIISNNPTGEGGTRTCPPPGFITPVFATERPRPPRHAAEIKQKVWVFWRQPRRANRGFGVIGRWIEQAASSFFTPLFPATNEATGQLTQTDGC